MQKENQESSTRPDTLPVYAFRFIADDDYECVNGDCALTRRGTNYTWAFSYPTSTSEVRCWGAGWAMCFGDAATLPRSHPCNIPLPFSKFRNATGWCTSVSTPVAPTVFP